MWFMIIIFCTLIFFLYSSLVSKFDYWKKRGVPNPPVSYLFGNFGKTLTLERSLGQILTDIYRDYPKARYVGYYKIRVPGIVVRDLELIKRVLIKDFNSFHDNDLEIDVKVDPLGGRNTFSMKGEAWKIAKNRITPCFTPKRVKGMFPFMEDAVDKLLTYIDREQKANSSDGFEQYEMTAKFATEVVATCAFGLDGKTFDEPNPKFREMGRKIFDTTPLTIVRFLLITIFPSLSAVLKIKFIQDEVADYFRNIVLAALRYREENNIVRNDFLDIMKELVTKYDDFNTEDVVANALGFFVDGFATSSSVMSYALFHIAYDPKIQQQLLAEINETLERNNGKIDYDILFTMKYLESVVYETMRMHPPGLILMRMVTQPTTFPSPFENGPDIKLEVGTPVMIPSYAIQNDPDYFTNADQFDPSRFGDNLKELQSKCIFLPFGEGPRNCHGQKFGLLQVKLGIMHLVKKYELKVNTKTQVPLQIDPAHLINQAKGGIWLNFFKR